jgi:signal transduction histidine kinase
MLENYRRALNPPSLLDIVPPEILQSLMQSFFFGFRAGMVLIYDDGKNSDGTRRMKRLEPVDDEEIAPKEWREKFKNFNPFCAKFRELPERNAMCEACDLRYAKAGFENKRASFHNECHMGLVDMTIPVMVGDQVRGVIFGGQRISKDKVVKIEQKVQEKAPEIAEMLVKLAHSNKEDTDSIQRFEDSFRRFAAALQTTISAFAKASIEEAERDTLLEISEELGRFFVEDPSEWERHTRQLFSELQSLLGGHAIWMLQRKGSRYQCIATSADSGNSTIPNIAVSALIETPVETLYMAASGSLSGRELRSKLGIAAETVSLIRCDTATSQTDVASIILVVEGHVPAELQQFMIGVARAFSHPSGVASLFQKMEKQQADFARNSSFTGHHLKTPLQSALFSLKEAKLVMESMEESGELPDLFEEVSAQLNQALADALRLQGAAVPPAKDKFELTKMLRDLAKKLEPIARQRNIRIEFEPVIDDKHFVLGVPHHIRVAFSNLLENAIKYSFENKTITVRIWRVLTGGKAKKNKGMVMVEIEDIGVGFSLAQKDALFSMGTRLDKTHGVLAREGRGIGLVQAQQYLESAGGILDIDSQDLTARSDRGSIAKVTAVVHLPIS